MWGEAELEKGGFGGILGVGAGSVNPPRMIELTYGGAGPAPIALTGKGIAFDSGGLSIKDAKGMETMKDDMGGAASILATMRAIALLKPKVNVIAAIPSSENMPSGSATKPGDVLTHRGGKTSEVLEHRRRGALGAGRRAGVPCREEAEGDHRHGHAHGRVHDRAGRSDHRCFGNDDAGPGHLRAGDAVGEPIWELPL